MYFVKSPWWLKRYYDAMCWNITTTEKRLYLTFDDGPHPEITVFVLDILKQYHAKATFFCIGKNVIEHPDIYKRIIAEGHSVGNHTHTHVNGWKTSDDDYVANIKKAARSIDSNLFRPPYGRISHSQIKLLQADYRIIMWDVLSADFDTSLSAGQCWQHIEAHATKGSIVVFHDSEKAFDRMQYSLSKTLEVFTQKDYSFDAITSLYTINA